MAQLESMVVAMCRSMPATLAWLAAVLQHMLNLPWAVALVALPVCQLATAIKLVGLCASKAANL